MIYKITFFKRDITHQDWCLFFDQLFSVAACFELSILVQGNKLDFFLKCKKQLNVINDRLFPFYLSHKIQDEELKLLNQAPVDKALLPAFISKDLLRFLEDSKIDDKSVVKIRFKLNKFNPLRTIPKVKFTYSQYGQLIERKGRIVSHLYEFLSIDLTKSIVWDISKVKPRLKITDTNLNLTRDGFLHTNHPDQMKIGLDSYDFNRHSLILGQSGSGKSYLAKLMIDDLYQKFSRYYGVVLIDPHASLERLLVDVSKQDKVSIDFQNQQTNLFLNVNQPVLSTELTIDLFSTILQVHQNQHLLRTLKYSLSLLFTVNKMSLTNLKRLLTDTIYRKDLIKEVSDPAILKFFETEFQQMKTQHFNEGIMPIINLISELDFIESNQHKVNLPAALQDNFLVSFPINQARLGNNVTKIVGGAIIQQIFTLMQTGSINKRMLLVVDEFAIIQNPSLIHILSEARKFGLTIILTQQYLLQVSGNILSSIFANMVNYFCFKLSRDDAEVVARNLNFEIDEYFLKDQNDPREALELGTKLLTDLGTRELITRLMANGQYGSPFEAKTIKVN